MPDESPGTPATANGLGTTGNLNDARMRESTERTAAADAAVEEEATKAAAEAAAREEEMRQEGVRAAMEARRLTEEHARRERERATEWVLGSFMTFGTLQEAQQLIVELGLVSPDRLSRLAWMDEREFGPGTRSQRSWFFNARKSEEVVAAMAAAACHAYVRTKEGKMWKFCQAARRKGVSSPGAAPTWSRATAPAWAPKPATFPWGTQGNHWTQETPRAPNAHAAGRDEAGTNVAAVLEAFKQELRKDMLSIVEKALSVKAAAPPAAAAAQGEGEANEQALKAQVQQLQQAVAELKESYREMQGHYHKAFADLGTAQDKLKKQEAIVQEQAECIKRLESPFKTPSNTPLKSAFAASHQGELPSLTNMPVLKGGMFATGEPGVRADRDQCRGRMWSPVGGKGADLTFTPCIPGVPFFFNSALPVGGVVPVSPAKGGSPGKQVSGAGGQAAGKEEAKGQEVRKEEEGGQPAAAAAPVALAVPS
jgi:hypothetical protein